MPSTPSGPGPQPQNALPPAGSPGISRRRLSLPLLASLALHALLLALLLRMPATTVTGTPGALIDVSLQTARQPAMPGNTATAPPTPTASAGPSAIGSPPSAAPAADADFPAAPTTGEGNDSMAAGMATPVTAAPTDTASATAAAGNTDEGSGSNELALLCSERPLPAYPPLAAREGVAGHVDLNVHVGSDGRVDAAWVKTSSGSPRLDRAAIAAVMRWRCRAPTKDGQPADIVAAQRITFAPP